MDRYKPQLLRTGEVAHRPLNKKAVIAWCFYDWANSSYFTIVLTFIFAPYFIKKVAVNPIVGTSQWGNTIAISSLIIAVLSPVLGAIADYDRRRKPWIIACTLVGIVVTALLWFAKAQSNYVYFTLSCVAISLIAIEVAIVFYNSMLKDLVPSNYLGRISGWAWGLGYLGGLACLSIAFIVFVEGNWFDLNTTTFEQVRICGPLVAIWFALFSIPLFVFTPDHLAKGTSILTTTRRGLQTLLNTLRSLGHYREILKFLFARMLYIDGLNTIFAFGGIYAAGTFGMNINEVIQFGIAMNIAAGIGAASFAWLDDYIGAKPTIVIALIIMIMTGIGLLLVTSITLYWAFAIVLSLCVGPVQAASRSLMARLAPQHLVTEMFGLYALSGKATSFIGPWLFGFVTLQFASQRYGLATILFFLLFGLILMLFVNSKVSPDNSMLH